MWAMVDINAEISVHSFCFSFFNPKNIASRVQPNVINSTAHYLPYPPSISPVNIGSPCTIFYINQLT